jgi:hypothetical protein
MVLAEKFRSGFLDSYTDAAPRTFFVQKMWRLFRAQKNPAQAAHAPGSKLQASSAENQYLRLL